MTRVKFGLPAAGRYVQDFRSLTFRYLVAIDVEGFSQRHTAEQKKAQDDLESAMNQAAAAAHLDFNSWYRQPHGDGELAVLPEATDGLALVADYPRRLASALTAVNKAGEDEPRLRVRMAIHHGTVSPGRFGPVGTAPVITSRLVDAEIVRQQLRRYRDQDLVLIVSATIFNEIVQSRLNNLRPEDFRHTVIKAKGLTYVAYLCQNLPIPETNVAPAVGRSGRGGDRGLEQTALRAADKPALAVVDVAQ